MTERKWHSGPPPHVGWWQASIERAGGRWRWWDGCRWSVTGFEDMTSEDAAFVASCVSRLADVFPVEWTTYWPENARVPRIDPRKDTR